MNDFKDWLVDKRACVPGRTWVERTGVRTPAQVWEHCPRGDWLLWLLGGAGGIQHLPSPLHKYVAHWHPGRRVSHWVVAPRLRKGRALLELADLMRQHVDPPDVPGFGPIVSFLSYANTLSTAGPPLPHWFHTGAVAEVREFVKLDGDPLFCVHLVNGVTHLVPERGVLVSLPEARVTRVRRKMHLR